MSVFVGMLYELHIALIFVCKTKPMSCDFSILLAAISGPGGQPPFILCQNNILFLYLPCDYYSHIIASMNKQLRWLNTFR